MYFHPYSLSVFGTVSVSGVEGKQYFVSCVQVCRIYDNKLNLSNSLTLSFSFFMLVDTVVR